MPAGGPYGGFKVVCPLCGASNCSADAFLKESMTSSSGVAAYPMFYCHECDTEWNDFLGLKKGPEYAEDS